MAPPVNGIFTATGNIVSTIKNIIVDATKAKEGDRYLRFVFLKCGS